MLIQREKSQSTFVEEYNLKPFIAVTYKYLLPERAAALRGKELRQILQMLQRLSVLHPEQFLHDHWHTALNGYQGDTQCICVRSLKKLGPPECICFLSQTVRFGRACIPLHQREVDEQIAAGFPIAIPRAFR